MAKDLSERQQKILQFIGEFLDEHRFPPSIREIGERLFLALDTVKGHNYSIYGKLQVQRRTEAAARARLLSFLTEIGESVHEALPFRGVESS